MLRRIKRTKKQLYFKTTCPLPLFERAILPILNNIELQAKNSIICFFISDPLPLNINNLFVYLMPGSEINRE